MDIILIPLLQLGMTLIGLYVWAIIAYIILGWLAFFNVIDRYNRFVYSIENFLFRIIDPALSPIRRFLPHMGGFDFSPVLLFLGLQMLKGMLAQLILRLSV